LDQLRRMVIPALPGQAAGNAKGVGFGAVVLAGASVHPKGNFFWRQMPDYRSVCREGWISLIAGPSLSSGIPHHSPPYWASRKVPEGCKPPRSSSQSKSCSGRCARLKRGHRKKLKNAERQDWASRWAVKSQRTSFAAAERPPV